MIGMKVGEEKEIKLKPEEAYGEPKEELKKKIPRASLPQDQEPKAGMMMLLKAPDGNQIPAKITEVTDAEVTIDINHPLSGKVLIFKLKLVEILK